MNIQDRVWKIGAVVGVLLAIFLAVLSVKEMRSIAYVGSNANQVYTINVNGTGEAVAVPDIATISFTVTERAKTVAEAQTLATSKINSAITALKTAGIADKDIKTTSYSINPHYEYQNVICREGLCPPSRSVLTGYDVSQSTEIKVRDIAKVGELFTLIGNQGVQNVYGPSFSVENNDALKAEARAEAIKEAQDKANVLAKQLGVRLVRVMSFSESGDGYPAPMYFGMGGDGVAVKEASRAPDISTGEDKISISVSITYEIR